MCWSIWKDSNSLIFERERAQPEDVAMKGISLAREWNEAQGSKVKAQKTHTIPQISKTRDLPQSNPQIAVCMTDASWDANRLRVGLAWVLTGAPATVVRNGTSIQDFVTSPLVAEALAIREGLYWTASQKISHLWICSDNLTLIGVLINKTQRKKLLEIIKDIHNLLYVFVSIDFFHISKEKNEETDALAKASLRNSFV